jgi:prepilin-type N-terminal cleavage/methylation domain-containing protein
VGSSFQPMTTRRAFTLIELLVVIAVIALIAAITRIYFETNRKGSMAEDMADAVLAIIEKRK